MNDRPVDHQFSANSLSPEQLRQMQNIAALIGQGLLGGNLIGLNPMALQTLINPILQASRTPPNQIDSTSVDQQPVTNLGALGAALEQQQQSQQHQQIQQPQQQPQQPPPQQPVPQQPRQSQQQQLMTQAFTQRLQQQLQQLVQQSQRQPQQPQPHPSRSHAGDSANAVAASLSIRQQQSLQNSLQQGHLLANDQHKRKRGRPPLSKPGTSAGTSSADFNYMNMFSVVKNQQERERLQRKNRAQQERQLEIRRQQELQRQRELRQAQERERQRELQLQQERERQRAELERQRKAQHRMALADIDRERRRQHMIMVRNLEAYKRNEEREKAVTAMMEERNKQNERRMHQKRLEAELIKDLRKPVDDMMLKNQKPLATLNRIPGLKLPGKAFADLLMAYEFLYNFGETVGLELRHISDINTLQRGLLNLDMKDEDKLIEIMHHLCMFAIKDQRFPYTGSLKEIMDLPTTNEGLSQLVHFYLQVVTLNTKIGIEHESRLLHLIENRYFLSFSATQKAELLAYLCNELLCSQTVTKQMEDTIENVAKLRKDKWVLENELRKFRSIKTKRELKEELEQKVKEAAEAAAAVAAAAAEVSNGREAEIKDENHTDSNENVKTNFKKEDQDKKPILTNGSIVADNTPTKKEKDADTSAQQSTTNDLDDLEPGMTNEELYKKIENLTRQYNKTSNKLERAINSMRASPLGQDRYRRRYWVLPQVGGVFVEGMESSEPDELQNNKFTDEELEEYEKEQELQALQEESSKNSQSTEDLNNDTEKADTEEDKDDEEMEVKEDPEDKDEDDQAEVNDEEMVDTNETKIEAKIEPVENGVSESDKQVSEPAEASAVTQEDATTAAASTAAEVAATTTAPATSNIPWFSILPRQPCDFSKPIESADPEEEDAEKKANDEETAETKPEISIEELKANRHEICPVLAKRLEELEAEQYESPRKIHPQYQFGWWRITDAQQLKSILSVLHERGSRERTLHKHLTKHFQYACNSCKNNTVDFEITSYDRQLAGKNYGAPMPLSDAESGDEEDEEEEEEEAEDCEEEVDDKVVQQAAVPPKKSKRKKGTRSARSRRLRARAAARKKVENSKNRLAQRIN